MANALPSRKRTLASWFCIDILRYRNDLKDVIHRLPTKTSTPRLPIRSNVRNNLGRLVPYLLSVCPALLVKTSKPMSWPARPLTSGQASGQEGSFGGDPLAHEYFSKINQKPGDLIRRTRGRKGGQASVGIGIRGVGTRHISLTTFYVSIATLEHTTYISTTSERCRCARVAKNTYGRNKEKGILTFESAPDSTPNPHGLVQPPILLIARLQPDKEAKPILLGRDLVALHGVQQPRQDLGGPRPPPFRAHHDVRRRRRVRRGEQVSRIHKGRLIRRQELRILSTRLKFL